ncbi:MAG TPA: hypothetical protein DCE42_13645 [Myxococcales bacterium]|nr:hypothetical protein [Deltaproteobacteria bacterium]MBU54292.1 hypothetical protein [Deltaproteobacteria bacterium]HAA55800.1 hypothetical protein [Myxococcales bacterium]|tara:strand:- start:5326 stop:6735 length:1410 start_codon:yes stop_codon:yes gene_type:complete
MMFAMSFQLHQLAFGNALNAIYSVLLLLIWIALIRRVVLLRQTQQQWEEHWETFLNTHEEQFNRLQQIEPKEEYIASLQSAWLGDLGARIRAGMPLPEPEDSSAQLLEHAFTDHPLLSNHTETHEQRWQQIAGAAILLGLLGTFFGLTAALTQLPVQGGLKELTGGLQQVLPLMGTAFWTSVCGLVASLSIRLINGISSTFGESRQQAIETLQTELTKRILHEVYPRCVVDTAESERESLQAVFSQAMKELQQTLQPPLSHVEELLQSFVPFQEEMSKSITQLEQWRKGVEALEQQFDQIARKTDQSLESITHTEKLLTERVAALTRQHQALTESIIKLEEHERHLPEKMKEVLKGSLLPAHQLIQRANLSLNQLFEQHIDRQTQDRQEWRHMIAELGDRFGGLERISHSNESMTHELARMTDSLLEIASRLRFHPQQPAQDNATEAIEAEIEELLEGIDATQESGGSS